MLDRWGGGNLLWHRMLAQQGYLVMSVDNRGTPAPRGRAWRKSVYRQVGILAPRTRPPPCKEVLQAALHGSRSRCHLGLERRRLDEPERHLQVPRSLQTAMAVAPVSNQRHYDTIYQERYMGLPGDNVDGYTQGSPINFAHQLKGQPARRSRHRRRQLPLSGDRGLDQRARSATTSPSP